MASWQIQGNTSCIGFFDRLDAQTLVGGGVFSVLKIILHHPSSFDNIQLCYQIHVYRYCRILHNLTPHL